MLDRISIMKQQEATTYSSDDAFHNEKKGTAADAASDGRMASGVGRSVSPLTVASFMKGAVSCQSTDGTFADDCIDPSHRLEVCDWCFRVVDHLEVDREIVVVAWSFIDRFLLSRPTCCPDLFKLCAVTSLYLAAKLSSFSELSLDFLWNKSCGGEFTKTQMRQMELVLLIDLRWKVHPPTSSSFVREVLTILKELADQDTLEELFQHALFFTELAVFDHLFATKQPSAIAFAAILNAVEMASSPELTRILHSFLREVSGILKMSHESAETKMLQEKLWDLYSIATTEAPEKGQFVPLSPDEVEGCVDDEISDQEVACGNLASHTLPTKAWVESDQRMSKRSKWCKDDFN